MRGVGLQPRGRHDDLAGGDPSTGIESGEVPVEAGEVATRAGEHGLDPAVQRDVGASHLVVLDRLPRAVWSSSVRSRCSCSVAGNSTRASPAANDGTAVYHSARRSVEVVGQRGRRARAPTHSARKRDGTRSVVRRRSPRGKGSTRSPDALESAASSRRWSSSTRDARSGQRAAGGASVDVGEQGVVPHPRGEEPFGESADEHAVEVESEPERDVPHQESVAEAPDPTEVGVELERERAAEDVDPRRRLDRLQAREPGQRGVDLLRCLTLVLGPVAPTVLGGEVVGHEPLGPRRELAPPGGGVDVEVVHERGDEVVEAARGLELAFEMLGVRVALGDRPLGLQFAFEDRRVPVEPAPPLFRPAHDLRGAADALPTRARGSTTVVEHGCAGQQTHHVVTLEVAIGQREQTEEPASEDAVGERAHRGAVVGDPGRGQLLVHESCVRIGCAVEHRHAFEEHAVARRLHHEAYDRTHLVVGIGRRHDAGRRPPVDRDLGHGESETRQRRVYGRVGARVAAAPRDGGDGHARAQCGEQPSPRAS